MTKIFNPSVKDKVKWGQQAYAAAVELKKQDNSDKDHLKIGFAFDDGMISVRIPTGMIIDNEVPALALLIYEAVIEAAGNEHRSLH